MKRLLYIAIVAGTCLYFGYPYWMAHKDELAAWLGNSTPDEPTADESAEPTTPAPAPQPHLAPPGIFYMLERVSVTNSAGVQALAPGEEVRLMQRKKNGVLRVTTGRADFDVKLSQVTNDLDKAQQARQTARTALPP